MRASSSKRVSCSSSVISEIVRPAFTCFVIGKWTSAGAATCARCVMQGLGALGNLPHFHPRPVPSRHPRWHPLRRKSNRDFVLGCQNGFERQHHASQFSRRSDGPQRPGRLANVWRKLKLDRVKPGEWNLRRKSGQAVRRGDRDVEMAALESEIRELARHCPAKIRDHLLAGRGQRVAGAIQIAFDSCQFMVDAVHFCVALFQTFKLSPRFGSEATTSARDPPYFR